ncbi:EIF2B2 [Lepeophtheirus salmonis]|uniref:Translation initiation factor eIF2B subunit beta n=1 Tax=Lepeophtheirus salmonis TaxID=72036 RepID=A0A7R8D221_LEPSM|nr:EIF2B2 [Lepeophtheirus salmonis]CAF2971790.1 EIF2B2 [Lepeophtheirus salmonis]
MTSSTTTKLGYQSITEISSRTFAQAALARFIQVITKLPQESVSASEIIKSVKSTFSGDSSNVAEANVLRRVLKAIREETASLLSLKEKENVSSLTEIATNNVEERSLLEPHPELKTRVLESLQELQMELESSVEEISSQAPQHIHADEVILTLGKSSTVEAFLKEAAKDRKFHVIVAEGSPFNRGRDLAMSLAHKIPTTLIPDSAIFAMMARVNKVIIGTHSVLADGGLEAATGSYTLALAAKHYSVPLIVCSPIYKLSPVFHSSEKGCAANHFDSPRQSLGELGEGEIASLVRTVNPVFEYVPPRLVTLFISNVSGHAPSYVYRLLSEFYHSDDYDLRT